MAIRVPYGAFNFLVKFDQNDAGGFSDVSGLVTEIKVAEYREGNAKLNHVMKVPGTHAVTDITLKRGIVKSQDLWLWINQVRTQGYHGKKEVTITMRDEAGHPVQSWILHGVVPLKYTGPTLAAKGGGDVAMEELVLSAEGMDFQVATG